MAVLRTWRQSSVEATSVVPDRKCDSPVVMFAGNPNVCRLAVPYGVNHELPHDAEYGVHHRLGEPLAGHVEPDACSGGTLMRTYRADDGLSHVLFLESPAPEVP